MKTKIMLALAVVTVAAAGLRASPNNSLFNPADYPALDTNVVLAAGTVLIDTKNGAIAPTWSYGTTNYTGRIVTNQSGKVVVALFNFGGLSISNAVSCTVTGNLGLVLSSTGDLTVASTIDLSGATKASAIAWGGPGAEGGARTNYLSSAPPGATRGNGNYNGLAGVGPVGFGAGFGANVNAAAGGYGGMGGNSSSSGGTQYGGTNYGDVFLTNLFGGSGGNGGTGCSGGGGGGSLELIANGTLTITATSTQKVNGGAATHGSGDYDAGGGSGGGILLAAHRLNVYGAIQANGGVGAGSSQAGGGGGGGGRIAFYADILNTNNTTTAITKAGGMYSSAAYSTTVGNPGTFYYSGDLSFPFGPAFLPSIGVLYATNALAHSATLVGNLISIGRDTNTTVSAYWGTNSAAWDFSTNAGPFAATGSVTIAVTGLSPASMYSFTLAASNAAGIAYAPTTNTFNTLLTLQPVIADAGVSGLTTTGATVNAYLSNTGETVTVVYLYYGATAGVWTATNAITPAALGPLSSVLTNLPIFSTWYYNFAASNADGWAYAATNSFTTLMKGLSAQRSSQINPRLYATLADSLTVASGAIGIDTGDGSSRAPSMVVNGTTYRGQVIASQSGNVWLSLFNFGGLAVSNGVSCTVTGNLGLVIASTGDLTMASSLDLSGANATSATNGLGGAGAEGGVRGTSKSSAPPGGTRGNGGYDSGSNGGGYGGGQGATLSGSGGGYGGAGGNGGTSGGGVTGGSSYGDGLLVDLFGGSGGGGSAVSYGGGGGGALQLTAIGTLTIASSSTQKVNGGYAATTNTGHSAGGGSGGGILLSADRVNVYGSLLARGGNGAGDSTAGGGGGGGGRIAFFANVLTTNASTVISVANGTQAGYTGSSNPSQNGALGSFRYLGDGQLGDLGYSFAQDLPFVSVMGTSNIQIRTAALIANLQSIGGDTNTSVTGYWGTNSAAWNGSATFKPCSTAGLVTVTATGLLPSTTYAFTFSASNASGVVFAPTTNSFITLPPTPAIVNVGASNITTTAATVYGYLSTTGESATVVYLYYGAAPGVWTGTNTISPTVVGTVSNVLTGFAPNTIYYYQFAALNNAGWAYAPTTNSFGTAPILGRAAQVNSLFNPQRYATLANSLVVPSGTIAIDTGDGTARGPSMTVNGTIYRGQVVPNQSSNVWLSLFNFGNLTINAGVSCTVTGNLGLVIASTGDLTMGTTLDLGGTGVGQGGPGAEGGTRTNRMSSAPAGANRGNGGYNNAGGVGYGGGFVSTNATYGGGGGYGGIGGTGASAYFPIYASGGTNYGDSALWNLFGGSGGAAGTYSTANTPTGGGGGGALELIANGTLTISATSTQMVNGGNAIAAIYHSTGAGSGGGIILAASRLIVAGTLQAKGGVGDGTYFHPTDGHNDNNTGGGGGGGRIALYATILTTNGMTYSVAGGLQGGTPTTNGVGAMGSFRYAGDAAGNLAFPYNPQGTTVFFQ